MTDEDKDRAEKELRETELRYHALFEQSPYGILIIDIEGNLIEFNRAAHTQLGYTRAEFAGLRLADIDAVQSPEEIQASIREVLSKGKADFEVKHRTKGGEIRDVRVITQLMDFSGRKVFHTIWQDITQAKRADQNLRRYREHLEQMVAARTAALTVVNDQLQQDISERKKIQAALRESEERYRLLFHKTPIGVFNYDTQLILTEWNDRFIEILQSSREKLLGLDLKTLRDRSVIPALREAIDGREGHYEGFYRATTGPAEIWILMRTAPIFDHSGKIKSCVGIVEDMTERKRIEDALKESEKRYRMLFESSGDAIFILEAEGEKVGKIVSANEAAASMHGFSIDELMTLNIRDLDTPESAGEAPGRIERMLRGEWIKEEISHRRKDGTIFPVEISAGLLEVGTHKYILAFDRDATGRREMEEELRRMHKLESVAMLAGGVAHDFKNLLTAVLGNIDLATRYVGEESGAYRCLGNAARATLRAADLTQQLLTFSKGGSPIRKAASIVEIIEESARFALSGSNVKCVHQFADNLWSVEVDEGQMHQVFHNLIINAAQAMPTGGVIQVRADNASVGAGGLMQAGKYVKIAIEDRGAGISEEDIRKIFDPYFTTKEKGLGLGLAVAYSIIRNHGGHITAESKLGAGTVFTLYLPASDKPIAAEKAYGEEPIAGTGRVLLMDDEDAVRDVAAKMLKDVGYEVEFAKDGREAIELYRAAEQSARPFDVVIMDLTVPGGMGGRETIKALRQINPRVKAVVSSGYEDDPVMANFRDYGFDAAIPKPYSVSGLSKIVHETLKGTNS